MAVGTFLLFWPGCDKGLAAAYVDPDYPDQQKAVREINEITRIMFTEWIENQVGDNPELLTKVVPDHPATGKRTLQDDGSWLRTLTRDDADLCTRWGERPVAYLGITVPGYPNLFCMYGPGTNLASGGSLIFHSECQMRYISA